MKSKASLSLIEQVIMILVFALCAAICLKIFTYADTLSKEKTDKDRAVQWAQNTAEVIFAVGGNFDEAAELLEAERTGNGMTKTLEYEDEMLFLSVEKEPAVSPLLGCARIAVSHEDGQLYSLQISWQEMDK